MKFTPSSRVYVLGAILCVALTICSRNLGDRGGPSFIASLAVAGIAYLLAIREFFSMARFPRRVVVIGVRSHIHRAAENSQLFEGELKMRCVDCESVDADEEQNE